MFTVFTVSSIEFNAHNQSNYNTSLINVDKGGVVFFVNKKNITEDIEKNHPYVKVINIETVFPNKLVVHYAVREETFAVKDFNNDKVYIIDDELKILRILNSSTYDSTQENAILIENLSVVNTSATIGEYLNVDYSNTQITVEKEYFNNIIKQLSDMFLVCSRDVSEQRATIKRINFDYDNIHSVIDNDGVIMDMYTFDDFLIRVYKPSNLLQDKIETLLLSLPACIPDYLNTHYLEILEDSNGDAFGKLSLKP